ncbi:phosphoglycerate mutase family protein, putative [Planococcus donghaensis MPA1U2]|uniref:Phosphoglycerate mutase family protein, putative n=1 Tax=Planococcus donghaensis MPA1U2 TaxID=933115 RepID=E7RFW3_9BACL|nr:histidine phosphatase family protein [Planococcus donghaensis]EGA90233.1 phosphoglycerate mutase family protein, putative [Planococcus donghaensis MPA1U2]
MELIFIRHGQGEHTLNLPKSLHMNNPSLTIQGRGQAKNLRSSLPLATGDVLIVSPTFRTLQTALIWSENIECNRLVHPMVAPRIFPTRLAATTLPCDELLDFERLQDEFPTFAPAPNLTSSLWVTGINVLCEDELNLLAEEFIDFCRSFQRERIYIVTHDGTITSYRQQISGQQLTREDFLLETEYFHLVVE